MAKCTYFFYQWTVHIYIFFNTIYYSSRQSINIQVLRWVYVVPIEIMSAGMALIYRTEQMKSPGCNTLQTY